MKTKTIDEINEVYDIEIEKIVSTIKKQKAGKILLQFPEGMKPYAQAICDEVEGKADCECIIWMGTCFGACDVPLEVDRLGVDLIVQFGHVAWSYDKKEVAVI